MSNQNFADLLKSARSAAGINKTELSQRLGIDRSKISEYEKGAKVPYNDRLIAICEVIGLDVKTATTAMAVSIQQDAERRKGNKSTRRMFIDYAMSCRRQPVPAKKHIGFCYCSRGKFSSIAALLRVCLARQKEGEQRCQSCEVLKTFGKDEKALKRCNITIAETKNE